MLQPQLDPAHGVVDGVVDDLGRAFLHFDFGVTCMIPGCPEISTVWHRGFAADLWLLAGALAGGLAIGMAGGVFVAVRPRARGARAVEAVATLLFCTPVYVAGFGLLLLFKRTFGIWPLPAFFEPGIYAPLGENPWHFLRGMLVPWLVLAAPVAGAALRTPRPRSPTASASPMCAPAARRACASAWSSAATPPVPDIPMLQALALWSTGNDAKNRPVLVSQDDTDPGRYASRWRRYAWIGRVSAFTKSSSCWVVQHSKASQCCS